MTRCPDCGFPLARHDPPAVCPKCDADLVRARSRKPLVIDLAHRGETVSEALAQLDKAVSECVWHGHPALKVIHGHGSQTGRAILKPLILTALRKHAERLGGSVLPDGGNEGAHILSFKHTARRTSSTITIDAAKRQ